MWPHFKLFFLLNQFTMNKKLVLILCCCFTAFIFSCNKREAGNSSNGGKNAKATDMTPGDVHNQICADIVAAYAQQEQVSWDDVFNAVVKDAISYGEAVPANLNFGVIKSRYLTNVTGWRDFYANMQKAGDISPNMLKYMTAFGNKIESEGARLSATVIQDDINALKSSPEYLGLNGNEQAQIAIFHDGFAKSYSFWSVQDQSDPLAKKGNPCKCGVGCLACVALFDAGGLAIPGCPYVTGPLLSIVARCCICSCCANTNCA